MPKKKAPSPKPRTHFEQVPLEVVVKVAAIDPPLERDHSPAEPIVQSSTTKTPRRTKE